MRTEEIKIIEIEWNGPYSLTEAKAFKNNADFGLYQIYGTHSIQGPNSLLYIGQANYSHLGKRLGEHEGWIDWEPSEVKIYFGRLGGTSKIDSENWKKQIDQAEKLLIRFCSPPYNASNIKSYGKIHKTVVLNFGRKNRLPFEVSTLLDESEFWKTDYSWKPYLYE